MKLLQGMAISMTLLLGACSAPNYDTNTSIQVADSSEQLGTGWGDEVNSRVNTVDLRRVDKEPLSQSVLYYADKNYSGTPINNTFLVAGKVSLTVEGDNNYHFPMFRDNGNYYLQGKIGKSYKLVYQNNSKDTIYEVVASVDGLDVLDGSSASKYNGGYVLNPQDTLVIEGFRKSQDAVASFIFAPPKNSYSNQSNDGSINNTGVIGHAIYELYDPNKRPSNKSAPTAFPADNGYAPAPN